MLRRTLLTVAMMGLLIACGPAPIPEPSDSPTSLLATLTDTQPSPTPSQLPPPNTPTTVSPSPTLARVTIPITEPILGDTWLRPSDGMQMVFIPAGRFQMGSMESEPCAHLDELPRHTVHLDGYWIDHTEVTNAQYRNCVEAGFCTLPICDYGDSTYMEGTMENHPVGCVNWYEASAYCERIGGQLPTEAQWEKAARGTDVREYPWGEGFGNQLCNSSESAINDSTPVGQYSPAGDSPYGVADMAGNVWEWVFDWYDIGYYATSPNMNPSGPQAGENRAVRGGSWYANHCSVRTTYRYYNSPYGRSPGIGFRCVLNP